MPFDYTSAKIDWNALPELVHPLGGQLPPERLDKKCQQLENLTAAVKAMARPGQVIVDFCSGGGHLAIVLAYLLPEAIVYLVENKQVCTYIIIFSHFTVKNKIFFNCSKRLRFEFQEL